jgi:hypothetical protein
MLGRNASLREIDIGETKYEIPLLSAKYNVNEISSKA